MKNSSLKLNTYKVPNVKPKICLVCNYKYYYRVSLFFHILTHH